MKHIAIIFILASIIGCDHKATFYNSDKTKIAVFHDDNVQGAMRMCNEFRKVYYSACTWSETPLKCGREDTIGVNESHCE